MPKRTKKLVVVSGNIGVGKTTITKEVARVLGWNPFYEPVDENPYLNDFYRDMKQWSFHLQIYFLTQRLKLLMEALKSEGSSIFDRSIYEDPYIFAAALNRLGHLIGGDYETYIKLFEIVSPHVPKPDLLIHLKAPVEVLMQRIHGGRARAIESGVTSDYLETLESFYNNWISGFDLCPVIIIDTHEGDIVDKPTNLLIIVEMIRDKLGI